jgi:hypothetical protein
VVNSFSASNTQYCQSFTYPEIDATNYRCGTTSDTTWQTMLLMSPLSVTLNSTTSLSSASALETIGGGSSSPSPSTTPAATTGSQAGSPSHGVTPTVTATLPTNAAISPGPVQGNSLALNAERHCRH